MSRFDTVINGPDYKTVRHFALTGTLSSQDGKTGSKVLQPTYSITTKFRHLMLTCRWPVSGVSKTHNQIG
jgi:hypothetical protein